MTEAAKKIYAKAKRFVQAQTTKMLCESLELTNDKFEAGDELARKWITEELERRHPVKFDTWIMCEDMNDLDFPSKFFL